CTASMDSVRIVLTTSWSRRSCSVVAALFTALLIRRPSKAPMVTPRRGPCQRKVQPTRARAGRLECRQASERPATGTPGALQRSHGREGRAAVTLESRRALRARAGPAGLQRDHSRRGARPRRLAGLLSRLRPVPDAALPDHPARTPAVAESHGPPVPVCRPRAAERRG